MLDPVVISQNPKMELKGNFFLKSVSPSKDICLGLEEWGLIEYKDVV